MKTASKSEYIINTYAFTLAYTVEQCLDALARLDFDEFELMMYPGHIWPNEMDTGARRKLKAYLRDAGLKVRSINQPNIDINLAAATPEMRNYSLDILKGMVELAGELEAPGVVLGPGKVNPLMPLPRSVLDGHFFKSLDVLVPMANAAGTTLLVENMPFSYLPDIKGLLALLDSYGAGEIKIIYDVANGYFAGEELGEALQACRARLKLLHVSDTGLKAYKHDPVGFGEMDFAAILKELKKVDWTDRPVLEIIGISDDPTRQIMDSINRLAALGWRGQFRS